MRRPWVDYHDCRKVYIERLQERDQKISDLEDTVTEKDRLLALKTRTPA